MSGIYSSSKPDQELELMARMVVLAVKKILPTKASNITNIIFIGNNYAIFTKEYLVFY